MGHVFWVSGGCSPGNRIKETDPDHLSSGADAMVQPSGYFVRRTKATGAQYGRPAFRGGKDLCVFPSAWTKNPNAGFCDGPDYY